MGRYTIGGYELVLNCGELGLLEDRFIQIFHRGDQEPSTEEPIIYDLIPADLSQYKDTPMLHYCGSTELHKTEKGRLMIAHWGSCRFAYGFLLEELMARNSVRCYYSPRFLEQIPLSVSRFLSIAGLSSKLLQRDAVILHCSYVARDGEAILFAGPSGAGKSTQAALWEQTGRGRIINGDRALLRQVGGRWYAFGYPCCGSSQICLNETMPIKAIVLLQKGKDNTVLPVSNSVKLKSVYLGLQVYPWEQQETDQAYALAQRLVRQVPVLTLSAAPEQEAVSVLDQYLNWSLI